MHVMFVCDSVTMKGPLTTVISVSASTISSSFRFTDLIDWAANIATHTSGTSPYMAGEGGSAYQ